MVRTTVYLPDELHEGLKHLAVERHCSMADLLRMSATEAYASDLKDLRAAQQAWKKHLKAPGKAIPARAYFGRKRD